jgi:hypothetical protein
MSDDPTQPCPEDRRLTRPRYFTGKLLTVQDLSSEQSYFLDKLRAHNRFLHGSGTVCGLEVGPTEPPSTSVVVQPGVALDCCGREIVVDAPSEVDLADVAAPSRRSSAVFVTAEYREIEVEPAPAPAGLPGGDQATAIREVAEIAASVDRPLELSTAYAIGGVRPCQPCPDPRVLLAVVGVKGRRPVTAAAIDMVTRPVVATPTADALEEPPARRHRGGRLPRLLVTLGFVGWLLCRCRSARRR